jgi:hypothetical protein
MTKLIGTDPNQVPSNADLGDMAYQDSKTVSVDRISIGMQSSPIASSTDLYNNPALLVKHNGHGVAMDYVGSTLPYQAGLFTSSTAHTQTAYGDLNIKARTDYGGNYGIGFFTASSNNTPVRRAYFNSTGNLVFENGKGIDFSASEGGGASGSLLSDYEEGTWTPTINSGTINPTNTRYVKVGSLVTIYANIADISDHTSATDMVIGGLPYSSSSLNQAVGSVMYRYFTKTNATQMNSYLGTNTSSMSLYWSFDTNTVWQPVEFQDGAQAYMDVILSLTYRV